jgi:hypothetical protein
MNPIEAKDTHIFIKAGDIVSLPFPKCIISYRLKMNQKHFA